MNQLKMKQIFFFLWLAAILLLFPSCTAVQDWLNRNHEPPSDGITDPAYNPQQILTYQEAVDAAVTSLTMILSNEEANNGTLPLLRSDDSLFCRDILLRLLADRTGMTGSDGSAYTISCTEDIQKTPSMTVIRKTLLLKNPGNDLLFRLQLSYPGKEIP